MFEEERIRLECNTCCYAVSGVAPYAKADSHESDNPNHYMKEIHDDELD